MEPDKIHALAKRVKQRLGCSQQRAEYIAFILALEHTVAKESFALLAEINAIHTLHSPSVAG